MLLFLLTVITRIPFTSKLFFHSDSVNFALALQKYDITLHQPHPPGYFLYVMLGKLLNFFITDANKAFVSISIFFSALTVVAVYHLGRELYDKKTGIVAAMLALASPNLWFHGEVALTYVIEAFFSTSIAYFCWKTYRGKDHYAWTTAFALGIAGGIRQNSPVFLLLLWFFSMKNLSSRKVLASLAIFSLTNLCWFLPMIWMTGGWHAYSAAFQELWLFNTGHNSVFEAGWPALGLYIRIFFGFIVYGLGTGILVLSLAAYSLTRYGKFTEIEMHKTVFFSLWVLPSALFHMLVFIHPANPGYALLILPALIIVTAAAIEFIAKDLEKNFSMDLRMPIVLVLMIANTCIFLFTRLPISYPEIRDHDRYLSALIDNLKTFDPATNAIFLRPYIYYGTRHIMYYLPEYRVYEVDRTVAKTGEVRNIFWGMHGQTYLSDEVVLPEKIANFVTPFKENDKEKARNIRGLSIMQPFPSSYPFPFVASGPVRLIKEIYPELRVRLPIEKVKKL